MTRACGAAVGRFIFTSTGLVYGHNGGKPTIAHHADVAGAVACVLDAASPAHRIFNLADDEAPDLATVFASVGAPPPDGSNAERARAFDSIMDGRRIREELGFKPKYPRLADAIAAGA